MYDWAIWLFAQIPLALVVAVAYFGRDTLASWLNAKTKHTFDARLEALKSDLAAKGREIDALRSAPLSTRAARQAMVDKRRLEAIDQLWGAVKIMQTGKGSATLLSVINWEAAADATKRDSKARELFTAIGSGSKIAELFTHDAHAAQPYISPLASALFKAYSLGIAFVSARMAVLQTGAGKEALSPPEPTFKALSEALPEWSEYISKSGAFGLPTILDELEKRLLAELQRSLDGRDDDKAQVDHAAKIVELAQAAERKLIEGKLPTELRS